MNACTPFPPATAVMLVHMAVNFQKKKKEREAEQERDSHKTQDPALRPGSKAHSLGLPRTGSNK